MISVNSADRMTHDDAIQIKVGHRMECNGYYGTVGYVGEVPPTKGIWLGIDWDDPSRGKHNGTHEGITYFNTRHSTSGSFVRLEKVNVGRSCPTAIRCRYGEVKNDETAGINKKNLALLQREINARFFEVVGFDKVNKKQSKFEELRVVWLREHNVNGPGASGELLNLCPNIQELDLSRNLIHSWQSLASIAVQLKFLRILNISENLLQIPDDPAELQNSFQALEHIVIGNMEYSWSQILVCASMWPNIEKLQVPFNKFTTLEAPSVEVLQRLTFLDLEGNAIDNWTEVNKLGNLPCLEYLNVSNTGVSDVSFPISHLEQKTRLFPSLKQLHLSENNIQTWDSVNELNKLLNLEELRFRENPVLQLENMETSRQLIIARIGNLKNLNGVVITNDERKGAEIDYLKKYGLIWITAAKSTDLVYHKRILDTFVQTHPRYPQLVDIYGAPDEEEYKAQKTTLNKNLIIVELFSPDHNGKTFKKKLPSSMQVQRLSGLVQRLFNTGNQIPKLAYISSKNPDIEFPLDKELKELSFYSIEDGDRISVRW